LEQQSDNPTPWLVFEPAWEPADPPAQETADTAETPEQPQLNEPAAVLQESPSPAWPDDMGVQIIRATRSWIQYGTVGFAVICIIIGALEGLFGH
jgi:hypothetical protein